MFIAEWPEEGRRYYAASNFVERDPILNALSLYRRPSPSARSSGTGASLRVPRARPFRVNAENGRGHGLAVAIPRGGDRFGLVTLLGRGGELAGDERTYLRLVGECLSPSPCARRAHRLCSSARWLEPTRDRGGPAGCARPV